MPYKRKRSTSVSAYKSKKYRRAYPYRRKTGLQRVVRKATISRIARQVVLSAAESKEKTFDHGKFELYHNVLQLVAPLNSTTSSIMPMQGDGDTQRNGDRIIARGFKVHVLCGQKHDRPNVTWRILVIAQKAGTGAMSYAQLFKNVSGNGLLDEVNDDQFTVLYHKYWKPQQSSYQFNPTANTEESREYTFTKRFFIPRKKLYKFETDGSAIHDDRAIYMYALPYDAWGSTLLDNIAYMQVWSKFQYKDP